AMLEPVLAAGTLDEDSGHGLGGGGEEGTAALPGLSLLLDYKPNVRLLDQGGGLERLSGPFPRQLVRRPLSELVVQKGQKLIGGVRVAVLNLSQDPHHFAHARYGTAWLKRRRRPATTNRSVFPRTRAFLARHFPEDARDRESLGFARLLAGVRIPVSPRH